MAMTPAKKKYQIYLPGPIAERFETLAARPGTNKSAILAMAITAWMDRKGANELDDRFGTRFRNYSLQLDRFERDQRVVMETLALFIRLNLQRDSFLPDTDEATRARGAERFRAFVAEVGRRLAQDEPSFDPLILGGLYD
ncbi:hypothetical protein AEAC466_10805 [Asticcacaulis sp. AC466]|jgi:hypothetical protein|uniref:hypothetical protein n=1 Tax=Asticcacaulis sp. AC466 TaxID=1282362 RepID=UPI0003C3FF7F|nr:hypothetical protein [Asticcacaulis sp. AC466]ESQ84226.1 hypothetical protein AEAC466_10805 [Asticcacaulis sp. AC466]